MSLKELLSKVSDFIDNERSFARATLMDYYAAHAPPMSQQWRSTYIENKNLSPTDPVHLEIEAKWRWAYAKKMVELRPHQKVKDEVFVEKVKLE